MRLEVLVMPRGTSRPRLGTRPGLKVLFVNENVGGHATYHANLAAALADDTRLHAHFFNMPPAGLGRRIAGAEIPGLARVDADLQRVRAVLAASAVHRRHIRAHLRRHRYDVVHVLSQNAAFMWPDLLRELPSVVALDSTNELNAYTGFRPSGALTPVTVRLEQAFERRVYRAATLVAPLSDWAAASLGRMGVPPGKVRVVPFGVPVTDWDDEATGSAPPGRPEIVFVGRHLSRKGGLLLLDLHARHLADRCTLTMVTPEPVPPAPGVHVVADITPGDGRLDAILRRASMFVFPSSMDLSLSHICCCRRSSLC